MTHLYPGGSGLCQDDSTPSTEQEHIEWSANVMAFWHFDMTASQPNWKPVPDLGNILLFHNH